MTTTPGEDPATATPPGAADSSPVVLDADGLDVLELVLGGWLSASALPYRPAGGSELVLTDPENTPLARIPAADDATVAVEPSAPLASGSGPQWARAVRMTAAEVRAMSGARGDARAVVVDRVPTRGDLARASAFASSAPGPLFVVVPIARRPHRPGTVGAAGLTRAAWGLADEIEGARAGLRVIRVVVPAPSGVAPGLAVAGIDAPPLSLMADDHGPSPRGDGTGDGPAIDDVYPPASAAEVRRARSGPAAGPGAVVLFTGLSGSGKSTIARALADELADDGTRLVTLLDGDEVRRHLSAELGFDAMSRERNVERIGWVAALVARHGGIAIAAPIAPFEASRARVRAMAEDAGAAFLLVWISTPLEVCEARDRKGLYARARAGTLTDFTGISSPYEAPADADLVIDTATTPVDQATAMVAAALDERLRAG